jgi:hypothetical protein
MSGLCLSEYSLSTRLLQWWCQARMVFRERVELAIYTYRVGIPRTCFDVSRKEACARSLTGFFANNRSSSRLYSSVLTGLMCTHSSRIPVVLAYASLSVRSQNPCKLRVSCRVSRRHHIHRLIRPASGLCARQVGTRRMVFKSKSLFFVDPTRLACVPRAERRRSA